MIQTLKSLSLKIEFYEIQTFQLNYYVNGMIKEFIY